MASRLPRRTFRGLHSVHFRYGPHAALPSLKRDFLEVLQAICCLLARPKCFRPERERPGGYFTHDTRAPFQGTHNNIAERAVRNLLVHIGILPETARIAADEPMRVTYVGGADYFVYASENGVWEPCVELGDMVRAGQLAARIHTPETPWAPPAEVRFGRDGMVLVKRVPGRTLRGDCLFHLSTDTPPE